MLTTCAVSHISNSDKDYVPAECGPRPVAPDELIPWIPNPQRGTSGVSVRLFFPVPTPLGLDTHFAPTTPHPASTSCFGASHRLSLLGSLVRKPHTIIPCEAVSPALAAHVPPGRYRLPSWAEALRTCPNVSPSFLLLIRTTCIFHYSTSYTIHCQCFSLPRNERRPKKLTLAARVHGTVANEVSGSHPGQSKYCLGC